ncbi:MAG: TonB-dependent receptor [Planctomycetaceae bacterium]|nr:TonB-dependent receptor [Planctomycetaceae bacterium]
MNLLLALLLCFQDPVPAKPAAKPDADGDKKDKEVVIVGQRRESDILDVPSGVTVVTAEQIRESGATNVVEVVQKQTGFFSSGPGKSAADQVLDLRGFNNGAGNGQRTLILVDGRKTNSVAGSATDWAAIPLENIERIEITRGPAAALYGDTALAGAVNIITKKGGAQTRARVSLAGGAWDTFQGSASAGGPLEGGFYDAFVAGESTQGYRDHQNYQAGDFTFRFDLPVTASLNGNLKVGHHGDTRQRAGSLSQAEIDTLGRRASSINGFPSEFRGIVDFIDVGLDQSTDGYGRFSLFFNYTGTNSSSQSHFPGGDFIIDDRSGISMLQPKHVGTWKIFGREATFTTGMDLSYEDAHSASRFAPFATQNDRSSYRRRLLGAYENIEFRPLDPVVLSGGARYDRALLDLDTEAAGGTGGTSHTRAFDQISPMAGVLVHVVEEVSVYASYGRPFKYPTRDELIGFTSSAPDLLPERSTSYEAGVRAVVPKWGSGSVTVYRMKVRDEIYFDPTFPVPPFLPGTNVNVDEVTHQGIESELRVTPLEFLEVFATHTFTRAEITQDQNPANVGNDFPVTPRLQGTVGGTVRSHGVAFTLLGRYVGERLLIGDFANTAPTLPSYWLMDTRLAYTYNLFTAFASVYNLADRKVIDNGGANLRFNPAPGRSFLVGGEFSF